MDTQSDLKITYRDVEALVPYAKNARTHSDEQITELAASINEFGFTAPILVHETGGVHIVVAGHGRLLAAKRLGMQQVPTINLAHMSDEQRRAYAIADNKLALNAGWDESLLSLELKDLSETDIDMALLGFSEDELAGMLALADATGEGLTDPDEVPPEEEIAVSRPGDIWVLSNHRLMCGDSTDGENVAELLNGHEPHLMVTDPPYGVEYDPGWRQRVVNNHSNTGATGKVNNDNRADWSEAYKLFNGDVAYIWSPGGSLQQVFITSIISSGFEIRNEIIWAKSRIVISRGHYHGKHEPCWYAVRKGKTAHWAGDRKQTTLWEIPSNVNSETGHSTQKPVECMRRPIENSSTPGKAVYEPFSGSGTTIIAAEQTGRRCYAMEIHPNYVDIAVRRWQNFTGKDATLESTGETFNVKSVVASMDND